jgi:D-alanyl-lipoteichoic acid acyltransferase DltB (MBOAT superfamily)
MDFTSVYFLGFLAAAAAAGRLCPSRFRAALIAVISYAYYCTWSPKAAILLLAVTVAAYFAARAIGAGKGGVRSGLALVSICGLVAPLAVFKLAPWLESLLRGPLIVPLGISYFTFKLISYVLDVYWGKIAAEKALIPFIAYVAFFPQIVAGPIQRGASFLPQTGRAANWGNVVWGAQRVLLGLFKKFLVADNLGILVNFIYTHIHAPGTPLALGLYVYPLQIYADFSGLTDIAVGAAWMLGIESPENFDAPFSAPSPSEFWRRWHITLTGLLTDYLFTPMRLAVRNWGNPGLVLSLFVTMVSIGLWHGFRWTYALFGMLHAAYLAADALTLRARTRYFKAHPAAGRAAGWLGPVVTFHLVALAFVLFRGENVRDALHMLRHLGEGIGAPSADFSKFMQAEGRAIWFGLGAYAVAEIADYLRRRGRQGQATTALPPLGRWAVYYATTVAAVVYVLLMLGTPANRVTFVYSMF